MYCLKVRINLVRMHVGKACVIPSTRNNCIMLSCCCNLSFFVRKASPTPASHRSDRITFSFYSLPNRTVWRSNDKCLNALNALFFFLNVWVVTYTQTHTFFCLGFPRLSQPCENEMCLLVFSGPSSLRLKREYRGYNHDHLISWGFRPLRC